jgi:hypothetical protein
VAANSRAAAEQSATSAGASASAAAQSAAHAEAVTENTYSRIDRTDKRVTNLERSVYGDLARVVVDDSVARVKDVPAAAKPNARVDMIGGMTYRVNIGTEEAPEYVLRSASAEKIESVGANMLGGIALANRIKEVNPAAIINTTERTISYHANGIDGKIIFNTFKPDTRYTFIIRGSASAWHANLNIKYTDGTASNFQFSVDNVAETLVVVSSAGKSIESFVGAWYEGSTTLYYDDCGIFEGVLTAEDFKPYVKLTLPIPEAVRSKPWYGLGISKDVCNAIRYNADGSRSGDVKCGAVVFDGSADEDIRLGLAGSEFTLFYATMFSGYSYSPAISNNLPYSVSWDASSAHFYVSADSVIFVFPNSIGTDVASVRAYLSANPLEVVYELANPYTEDISDIMPADNYIGVEGGGTLTFVNEYGYDVPSEAVFVTKEVTE